MVQIRAVPHYLNFSNKCYIALFFKIEDMNVRLIVVKVGEELFHNRVLSHGLRTFL